MLTTSKINELLEITESYKAPESMMKILFNRAKRENAFRQFLEVEHNLSFEWFQSYFENEHSDRKVKKQDFTPYSISIILSKLVGNNNGMSLDVAAGTGGITIAKWNEDRLATGIANYKPSNFFYQCEELSDRAIPFLLFNLMIRGMNASVVHGDVLTREVKQVYFVQNITDNYMSFSSLNVMPHSETVKKEFKVHKWIEEEVHHIENSLKEFEERGLTIW